MAEDTKEYREWIASLSDEEKEQVDLLLLFIAERSYPLAILLCVLSHCHHSF